MNNTLSTQIQTLVNKLPITLYFEEIPDRKQALKYIQWLFDNVPESKTIKQDLLFREIISKELRLVSMKIIEIEILLMVGLETITLNDFSIDSKTLINKLISENHDNYDLDIMYRIMAQIMTKLPKDLKERVTGKQKLQIFQKLSQFINIDNKLLEQFASVDPSLALNTPISMELDEGDYNTLNKKYLYELKNYEESKGYVSAESMEYSNIAKQNISSNKNSTNNLKAKYIDNNPDFMLGKNDNTLYYFDSSSGALTEMPLNGNQKSVSLKDLKTILTSNKVKHNEIQGLIDDLQKKPKPTPSILSSEPSMQTQPKTFFDTIGSLFTSSLFIQAIGLSQSTLENKEKSTPKPSSKPTSKPTILCTPQNLPIPPKYISNSIKQNNNNNMQEDIMYDNMQEDIMEEDIMEEDIMEEDVMYDNMQDDNIYYNNNMNSQINNLESRYQNRRDIYSTETEDSSEYIQSNSGSKSFLNRTDNNDIYPSEPENEPFTNMNEEIFLKKIKNDNKQIENVALSFVTILILLFLLVIFNSIRNNK
jgi:hypothetical protein